MNNRLSWNERCRRAAWMWVGALTGAGLAPWALETVGWFALPMSIRMPLWAVSSVAGALVAWQFGPRRTVATASETSSDAYLLDTSAIIDGRIADVVETTILGGALVVPEFVIAELQAVADSSDPGRRTRGRRGLDVLRRLRFSDRARLKIWDRVSPEAKQQPVDMQLVLLARELGAKIVTADFNLNKVAEIHNVQVVNLNDVAAALRPQWNVGDSLVLSIQRPGQEPAQGVGYLDDGTMVVVEGGRDRIGQTIAVVVTSQLQTSAGRMIFARPDA